MSSKPNSFLKGTYSGFCSPFDAVNEKSLSITRRSDKKRINHEQVIDLFWLIDVFVNHSRKYKMSIVSVIKKIILRRKCKIL